MTSMKNIPSFDDLPTVTGPRGESMPQGCAWGVFDQNGKDVLGTLNLLTQEIVRDAYAEARDGICFSLNWSLSALANPTAGRRIPPEHRPIDLS